MLTVDVRIIADEILPGLVSGIYEIEEGTIVRDLIAMCESRCGTSVPKKNFIYIYPMFNGKPLMIDREIPASGTLHLCRVVSGG